MHGMNLSFFGEKIEKMLVARPGFELTISILEGESANHYTMDPLMIQLRIFYVIECKKGIINYILHK